MDGLILGWSTSQRKTRCLATLSRLMTDTQHSTLHVFDWGFLSVECESLHTLRFLIQIHGSDAGV